MHWILALAGALTSLVSATEFGIVREGTAVPLVYDETDAEVVLISAAALAGDIEQITEVKPRVQTGLAGSPAAIVIGTLGQSRWIDEWAGAGKLDVGEIRGKWESFTLQIVERPVDGLERALVIAGSDPRGTAYGVFELSRRLGISPWVWWADVRPAPREQLDVEFDSVVMGPPAVKYRGIFLNDEGWGLNPWAAKNMDTDLRDIGPKTYARIFELLLRLRGNYIWPAMHGCTKAFFYYDENPEMAARYNIVLGSSHCEPMLRNGVDEWNKNFRTEYGEEPGPWRYDLNEAQIHRYWKDRAKESSGLDAVYTVGMRGIHDSGMPGGSNRKEKLELLEKVIRDQRDILRETVNPDVKQVPQIFCPYKEVLNLYDAGLEVPEDITIIWPDDNHGYIRRLATPEEQQRSGQFGVYYHLSYFGTPEDYLWLSSISPALISFEMSKAYAYASDQLWVVNVGDIKPAELETEFFLDLAWDPEAWPPHKALSYVRSWAARTFNEALAGEIAAIQTEYYRLAASGKPEHMNYVVPTLTEDEKAQRLADYAALSRRARALAEAVPQRLRDAYYQLILYPVLGAANMNAKHIHEDAYRHLAASGDPRALEHGKQALDAYETIVRLTEVYNRKTAGGKWDGMMVMNPRNRGVFHKPSVDTAVEKPTRSTHAGKVIELDPADFEMEAPMRREEGGILTGTGPVVRDAAEGGAARLQFRAEAAGETPLYFLAWTPTAKEDSWFVTVNGHTKTINDLDSTGPFWRWLYVGDYPLREGDNTLVIAQREPNARIRGIRFGKPGLNEIDSRVLGAERMSFSHSNLQLIPGLGVSGAALSRRDFTGPSYPPAEADEAPTASVELNLREGRRNIVVDCVPAHPIHGERGLRLAVRLNDGDWRVLDFDETDWGRRVILGYDALSVEYRIEEAQTGTLRIALLDPGLAISRVRVY